MLDSEKDQLIQGITTAFFDSSVSSNLAYKPQFLSNDYHAGKKVLSSIEDELSCCDEFMISVAFITMGGLTPLLQTLKDLERRGIPGRILTTDYLTFSNPKALRKLSELRNISIKMYITDGSKEGFHTKGYIFRSRNIYRVIVGSSNMTLSALTTNREWNSKIVSSEQGEYVEEIISEFNMLWDSPLSHSLDECIEQYSTKYNIIKKQKAIIKQTEIPHIDAYRLQPNTMQINFIKNLQEFIRSGENKALLISATGTGKTYASAFALREENPKKALFLVHREMIAKQALDSFQKVFGNTRTMGVLSGNQKDYNTDFLFSTMNMMAKPETLTKFDKKEFQIIVIDEVHRAGSESYKRIMSYFEPNLWLGMTASPERMDGFDIYALFDHNIAYEIRLQQALEDNLLCPFHYFGITELSINGETFDDNSSLKNFSRLICDERVNYILDQAEYYGFSGERVKGLIFCSRKEEARSLSDKFNERGFRTTFLSGDDSESKRESCIDRLTRDSGDDLLDYIFTIDIFNEGVDIPEINQVILLRPTQSPTIFVQQLGRGLRKATNKEYVVILDFIGNYTNNFMIPIALYGDRSYNKDTIRRYVMEGTKIIPGNSTIHFDEISKKRIFASIDTARTNDVRLLREAYTQLKHKLGHIPAINDFELYASIDVMKIIEKCGSYHAFLSKYEKEYQLCLSQEEEIVVEFLSRKILSFKRLHELALLKHLISQQSRVLTYFDILLRDKYGINISPTVERSVTLNLTNEFGKEEEKKKYRDCILITKDTSGGYSLSPNFQRMLQNKAFKSMVLEILDFGINRTEKYYSNTYLDTNLKLYQKYTYEDVCRLLNWERNMNAQNIGGYFYDSDTKTLPVFINYDKDENAIAYEDRFISESSLIALSKHPRKITSSDVTHIYKKGETDKDNRIFLFVRKNKDDHEAKEFYFLGEIMAKGDPTPIHMETTNDDAFEILYQLETPVRRDIYDYITS